MVLPWLKTTVVNSSPSSFSAERLASKGSAHIYLPTPTRILLEKGCLPKASPLNNSPSPSLSTESVPQRVARGGDHPKSCKGITFMNNSVDLLGRERLPTSDKGAELARGYVRRVLPGDDWRLKVRSHDFRLPCPPQYGRQPTDMIWMV